MLIDANYTGISGYACQLCGQFITYGSTHYCAASPQPVTPTDSTLAILTELREIKELLQRVIR